MKKPLKIILSGGGTGGHIYPALALADRLKEINANVEFLYIGTERGLESKVVRDTEIPFKSIKVEGFVRKLNKDGFLYNMKSVYYFINSLRKARKIIKEFQPDIVIGTGGYVCAPVLYQAAKLQIPTIIHEQNSVAGITNKFLARYVDKIAICFEEAADEFKKYISKVVYTGNPRAQEVANVKADNALSDLGLDPNKTSVIIFGGSRGAYEINQAFIKSYEILAKKPYQILFVPGSANYSSIINQLADLYGDYEKDNIFIEAYIDRMPQVFKEIDLVVSRSGATTLAELTALGLPSILIPSPNVTEDHQTKNARSLVNHNAAVMIQESDLTVDLFVEQIDSLMMNETARLEMANEAKKLGRPNASDDIIKLMLSLI
ncbi:MAG TPA: undecaprenyldiphospho-muramoylpentapeptide beta-N-acetylglucosaminyltransferase [Alloiococcus sp.]|nr:undecaprenyldiphospho-muramoylpentapeptide beta-N-acetylglucosaminyltransferase [Alloiococcus sp.]